MKALLYKRLHIFLRDLKGFLFLIFIPVVIVFAIVEVVSVCFSPCGCAQNYRYSSVVDPQSSFGGDIADVLLSTKPFNLGQPVPDRVPYLDYRAGTEWLG